MSPVSAGDYPEHEKLHAIRDKSQTIGDFLTWCRFTLCEWHEATGTIRNGDHEPEGWYPRRGRMESLLAEYFEIDENKLEAEKRAMLERLREGNP